MNVNGHDAPVVFFASLWRREPPFHRWEFPSDKTACGLELFNDRGDFVLTAIPPQHALKFGRPCRRCFA